MCVIFDNMLTNYISQLIFAKMYRKDRSLYCWIWM